MIGGMGMSTTGRTDFGSVSKEKGVEGKIAAILWRSKAVFVPALLAGCSLLTGCGTNSSGTAGGLHGSVQNSQNPLVAQYVLSSGCSGQAMVEFGPDTTYGRSTASYPVTAHQPTPFWSQACEPPPHIICARRFNAVETQ